MEINKRKGKCELSDINNFPYFPVHVQFLYTKVLCNSKCEQGMVYLLLENYQDIKNNGDLHILA